MKTNLTKIGITSAIAAGAIICSIAYQSAVATPEATPLIDSDFDAAVGKFLVKRFCKRIGATPEQTTKLSALVSQTRESTRPEREQLREGALELSELYASDEATDEQVKAKALELRAVHEKIMDERLQAALKARQVLSHEQREKINKRISDFITGDGPEKLHNLRSMGPSLMNDVTD